MTFRFYFSRALFLFFQFCFRTDTWSIWIHTSCIQVGFRHYYEVLCRSRTVGYLVSDAAPIPLCVAHVKKTSPRNHFVSRTPVSRLTYVKKTGLADTGKWDLKVWFGLNGGFTPCRHLRPSSGREHTIVTYSVRWWWWRLMVSIYKGLS